MEDGANKTTIGINRRNPDVLTCIANLSNDEVFTPPEIAKDILDNLEKHGRRAMTEKYFGETSLCVFWILHANQGSFFAK